MPSQSGTHHAPSAVALWSLVTAPTAVHRDWERQMADDAAGDVAAERPNSVFPQSTAAV